MYFIAACLPSLRPLLHRINDNTSFGALCSRLGLSKRRTSVLVERTKSNDSSTIANQVSEALHIYMIGTDVRIGHAAFGKDSSRTISQPYYEANDSFDAV